jgi:hypothetical protein
MKDQMRNHIRPALKTRRGPWMSAMRAAGRRNAPVTREKTLAGQVWDSRGMFRDVVRCGRRVLKPLTKYSCRHQRQYSRQWARIPYSEELR